MFEDKILKNLEKSLGKTKEEQEMNADKKVSFVRKLNKKLIHMEEFIIVGVVALCSIMLANMTGINDPAQNAEIASSLQAAINQVQPGTDEPRIISQWRVDSPVTNTFYKWYCTYWAALISPEFFPYLSKTEQQRTRWWNAVDRYLNAQLAWFPVWSTPKEWALIIYKKWDRFVNAWHVWRVMKYFPEYKKMIIRDMNRVWRSIMSDRREYENNDNILWYIYQKPGIIVENPERTDDNAKITIEEEDLIAVALPEIPSDDNVDDSKSVETSIDSSIPQNDVVPSVEPIANPEPVDRLVDLDLAGLSLEWQHFLSQWNVDIETDLNVMHIGDQWKFKINITNKQDGGKFSWILPIAFNFVTSSSAITLDYNTIQLMYDGEADIVATANSAWKVAILLNFGQKQLAKIVVEVD